MLSIGEQQFSSRLFLGTGKYASDAHMTDAILSSETQMVTTAIGRISE